jgi:hypothetical protein
VAENIRLGNEEEEVLHRKGDGDDNDGLRGRGGKGEVDMEGRRGRGLLSGPCHSN